MLNYEKILEEQNEELHKLINQKTDFLNRASHELKTPLAVIKANADLIELSDKNLNPALLSMISSIKNSCERIDEIIHKLIECSRLESSKIELKTETNDLTYMIEQSIAEVQPILKKRDLTINTKIEKKIYADFNKEQIQELISNLLSNTIKYSPPKGIIDIKLSIKEDLVLFSIKDMGFGFTEVELSNLFQKFGKFHRDNQQNIEGSGLGLYISKKIIEIHGGKIWIESKGRNKGSTVFFTLPIKPK